MSFTLGSSPSIQQTCRSHSTGSGHVSASLASRSEIQPAISDRVTPYFTQIASVSTELYRHDTISVRLQADAENLSNTLELIDFGGLFSGNAIGPGRMGLLHLTTAF